MCNDDMKYVYKLSDWKKSDNDIDETNYVVEYIRNMKYKNFKCNFNLNSEFIKDELCIDKYNFYLDTTINRDDTQLVSCSTSIGTAFVHTDNKTIEPSDRYDYIHNILKQHSERLNVTFLINIVENLLDPICKLAHGISLVPNMTREKDL